MLKISLTKNDKDLLHYAKSRADIPTDRITTILLADQGMKVADIADVLGKNPATIRTYFKSYLNASIDGLSRSFSPGRPSKRKTLLIPFLEKVLPESPTKYGWDKATWDSTSIIESFKNESGITISHDTVSRAMKELGYSYKKPQKSPSINAPSKEAKREIINNVISLIRNELDDEDAEVYCSDESHFTNEPYLPRGYFKKGTQNVYSWAKKEGNQESIWFIESSDWTVLLEKR